MTKTEIYQQTLEMFTMLIPFKKAQLNNPNLSIEENNKNLNEYYSLISLKDSYEKMVLNNLKNNKTASWYNKKDYCICGSKKSLQSKTCAKCQPLYTKLRKCDKKQVIEDVLRGDLYFKQVAMIHGISVSMVNKIMIDYRKGLKKSYEKSLLPE